MMSSFESTLSFQSNSESSPRSKRRDCLLSRASRSLAKLVTLSALIAFTDSSPAAVVVYFGGPDQSKLDLTQPTSVVTPIRNNFLAAIANTGIEDVELLAGQQNPTLTFGSTGITGTTGFPSGGVSFAPYSVSGTAFLLDTDGVADSITFSQPITAFGTYLVQSGDGASAAPTLTPPNNYRWRLENTILGTSKEVSIATLGPDWPFFNVAFAGVTDTEPFNRLSFLESFDTDGILYDDLTVGTAIPEPSTATLVGVFATILALRRSDRRRNSTQTD